MFSLFVGVENGKNGKEIWRESGDSDSFNSRHRLCHCSACWLRGCFCCHLLSQTGPFFPSFNLSFSVYYNMISWSLIISSTSFLEFIHDQLQLVEYSWHLSWIYYNLIQCSDIFDDNLYLDDFYFWLDDSMLGQNLFLFGWFFKLMFF